MKIFERITFPSSAVYNIQTEVGTKTTGSADVELLKSTINVVNVDVSNFTAKEAETVITEIKNCLNDKNLQLA